MIQLSVAKLGASHLITEVIIKMSAFLSIHAYSLQYYSIPFISFCCERFLLLHELVYIPLLRLNVAFSQLIHELNYGHLPLSVISLNTHIISPHYKTKRLLRLQKPRSLKYHIQYRFTFSEASSGESWYLLIILPSVSSLVSPAS